MNVYTCKSWVKLLNLRNFSALALLAFSLTQTLQRGYNRNELYKDNICLKKCWGPNAYLKLVYHTLTQ